jgi:hypothetical protein
MSPFVKASHVIWLTGETTAITSAPYALCGYRLGEGPGYRSRPATGMGSGPNRFGGRW